MVIGMRRKPLARPVGLLGAFFFVFAVCEWDQLLCLGFLCRT
jgi:hypothetical protein